MRQVFDVKTGRIEDGRCVIRSKDVYNLYPEFRDDGSVVYNTSTGSDPMPVGSVGIIYESLRPSDTGLTFNWRRLSEEDHLHPCYSIKEVNLPIKPKDSVDSVFEIFGDKNITMCLPGWNEQKLYKIPRVEICEKHIYGVLDKELTIIRPKCLKPVLNIVGTINFSVFPYSPFRKNFYLDEATNDTIHIYCQEWFINPRIAKNIAQILIAIKNGEFINLKEALINNDIDEETITSFLRDVGTVTEKSVYRWPTNISKYLQLYQGIERMDLNTEDKRMMKGYLLNYVLNSPYLRKAKVGGINYGTHERYWFAMMLARRAYKEGIMAHNLPIVPVWFARQMKALGKEKKFFSLFGKIYNWDTAPSEVRDEYIHGLMFNIGPNDLYPEMKKVEKVLELTEEQKKSKEYKLFGKILKAGRRWNITEIQTAWIKFTLALKLKKPRLFWNWLEEVIQDDWETANSKMFGVGNISEKKSFAFNLLMFCKFKDSFDTFDVKDMPAQDWYEATGHRPSFAYEHSQMFWLELSRVGLSWDKKKSQVSKAVEETNIDVCDIESGMIESIDSFMLPGSLSAEDLNMFSRYNPFTGEFESFGQAKTSQEFDMDNVTLEFGFDAIDSDIEVSNEGDEEWE